MCSRMADPAGIDIARDADERDDLPVVDHPADISPAPPTTDRRVRLASAGFMFTLVCAGVVLRFWSLGTHRLNFDESFTAMAARRPLGDLFRFLAHHDSHPPLDFLLRAPLARAGASEFLFRLPSVLCSCAALAVFAWWVRRRGIAGAVAVGLMAGGAFQLARGREARMYAEMELLGVVAAVLTYAWLRRARSWHSPLMGVLVLAGSMTHVSMLLLGAGLLTVPGVRRDREAWRWRASLVGGVVAWAAIWGPSFMVQARGGHSSWIGPTTFSRLEDALGRLVTYRSGFFVPVLLAVGLGALVLRRCDPTLARVWTCAFAVPVAVGAVAGTIAPVVLDRTFTVVAWAPLLAIGYLVARVVRLSRPIGIVAIVAIAAITVPSALSSYSLRTGPDVALRELERRAAPGDVVAVNSSKAVELQWSLGVRGRLPARPVTLHDLPATNALLLGPGPPTGRIWLLDQHRSAVYALARCAPTWASGDSRVLCLARATRDPEPRRVAVSAR